MIYLSYINMNMNKLCENWKKLKRREKEIDRKNKGKENNMMKAWKGVGKFVKLKKKNQRKPRPDKY